MVIINIEYKLFSKLLIFLFYQQLTENPNVNFDEYKPTDKEITSQKKNLKIILNMEQSFIAAMIHFV